MQPDSIVPGAANPQAFNRYSYANNNPIKFNDPSGHCIEEGDAPRGSPSYRNLCPARRTGGSIISNDVDKGYDKTLVGGVPATQPFRTTSYGYIEDSCDGCSAEGGGNAPEVGGLGLLNDILAAGLNAKAIYDEDQITVYATYRRNPGIHVNSLYINNKSNRPVSVMSVDFATSEWAPIRFCLSGPCLFPAPDRPYGVIPSPGIYAQGTTVGIGAVSYSGSEPIGLTTRISLVPSGNPYNSTNSFYWYTEVTIKVRLAYTDTGTYWPTISYTFDH